MLMTRTQIVFCSSDSSRSSFIDLNKVKTLHILNIPYFTLPPHIYNVRLIQNAFSKLRIVYIKGYAAGG